MNPLRRNNRGPRDAAYWKRLDALLASALDLPEAERERWIEALPPTDAPWAASLRDLLARSSAETGGFMQKPLEFTDATAEALDDDSPGTEIGPYRLIEPLGAGGMATVWIAERIDGMMKRRVALKLPSAAWISGLAARMRRERDILSALEHPCIARLYDAGATETGRPYLAMELVEGQDIDAYCNRQSLRTAARLELFLQVLRAVAHAHARLIVHRDLKPSNILVTDTGEVRLLDFGIATMLEGAAGMPTGAAVTSALTREAGRPLTLDYASPEQIRGDRLTVATDVYSLGVVLFQLLTGKRPYALRRLSTGAIEDAILDQEAPRASTRVERGAGRELAGDLDAIIGKALKKDAAARYLSVEAFADDIARYLAGEPVHAQPDSTWYQLRKFSGRHRTGVAAAATVLIAVLAGASVAVWQSRAARIQADRADAVKQFIASIFSDAVPRSGVGGELLATDLLNAAAIRVQREMADDPRAAAELGIIIGYSFGALGKPDSGREILQFAVPLAERELGPAHVLTLRGKTQYASVIMHSDPARAEAMHDAIIRDARPQLPASALSLAEALLDKGFVLTRRGAADEALGVLRESLDVARIHLGPDSETTVLSRGQLVNALGTFGRQAERLALATENVQHAQRVLGSKRPSVALINAERNYAAALRANDRPSDAIPLLRQVVADQRQLDSAETGRVRHGLHELGLALLAAGELGEALVLQQQIVALEAINNREETENRLIAREPLVATLLAARRDHEAAALMQEVSTVQARIGQERTRAAVTRLLNEARVLALQGDADGADRLATAAREHDAATALQRVEAMEVAAHSARMHGRTAKALRLISEAMTVQLPQAGSLRQLASLQAEHASILLDLDRTSEAAESLDHCRKNFQTAQVRAGIRTALCLTGQARWQLKAGDRAGQQASLRELTALTEEWQKLNPHSPWHGEALYWRARLEAKLGETALAQKHRDQYRPMLRSSALPVHRRLAA